MKGDSIDVCGHIPASPNAICATESRFVLSDPVTLRLRQKVMSFSNGDFKITCANSGVEYFKCQGKVFSLRGKRILKDNAGLPILNFKKQFISSLTNTKFNVYSRDGSYKKICKFNEKDVFLKRKITADFQDVYTGQMRHIVLKEDWTGLNGVIYLGEPKQGGIPIAKISRQMTGTKLLCGVDKCFLEIAAGVDIALVVAMCVA